MRQSDPLATQKRSTVLHSLNVVAAACVVLSIVLTVSSHAAPAGKGENPEQDGETLYNCQAVTGDKTLAPVTWRGTKGLSAVNGKPVRLRFHLRSGRLHAFWASPEESGASHGYVAAGGPGFTGPTDTVGMAAYQQ